MTQTPIETDPGAQIVVSLVILAFLLSGTIALVHGRRYYKKRPLHHPSIDGPLLRRPWRALDVLLIIAFYIVTHAALARLFMNAASDTHHPHARMTVTLLVSVVWQLAGLAFILLLVINHGCGWRRAFGVTGSRTAPVTATRLAALVYLAIWPAQVIVTPLYHAFLKRLEIPVDLQEPLVMLTQAESPALLALLLFMALIVAPINEELFFRGIILPVFRRIMGVWPAVIVSSLLFAVIHFHFPSMAGLFIVSMACSLAALWGGSVLPAIWLHVIFNTINTMLMLTLGQ